MAGDGLAAETPGFGSEVGGLTADPGAVSDSGEGAGVKTFVPGFRGGMGGKAFAGGGEAGGNGNKLYFGGDGLSRCASALDLSLRLSLRGVGFRLGRPNVSRSGFPLLKRAPLSSLSMGSMGFDERYVVSAPPCSSSSSSVAYTAESSVSSLCADDRRKSNIISWIDDGEAGDSRGGDRERSSGRPLASQLFVLLVLTYSSTASRQSTIAVRKVHDVPDIVSCRKLAISPETSVLSALLPKVSKGVFVAPINVPQEV